MRAVPARVGSRSPEVMNRPSFVVRRAAYGALTTLPARITRDASDLIEGWAQGGAMSRVSDCWRARRQCSKLLHAALAAVIVLAACGDGTSPTSVAPAAPSIPAPPAPPPPPVNIGFLVSGVRTYANGAMIAVEEANASGGLLGRPVELIVEENLEDAATAVEVAETMILDDEVAALIGPNRSVTRNRSGGRRPAARGADDHDGGHEPTRDGGGRPGLHGRVHRPIPGARHGRFRLRDARSDDSRGPHPARRGIQRGDRGVLRQPFPPPRRDGRRRPVLRRRRDGLRRAVDSRRGSCPGGALHAGSGGRSRAI